MTGRLMVDPTSNPLPCESCLQAKRKILDIACFVVSSHSHHNEAFASYQSLKAWFVSDFG